MLFAALSGVRGEEERRRRAEKTMGFYHHLGTCTWCGGVGFSDWWRSFQAESGMIAGVLDMLIGVCWFGEFIYISPVGSKREVRLTNSWYEWPLMEFQPAQSWTTTLYISRYGRVQIIVYSRRSQLYHSFSDCHNYCLLYIPQDKPSKSPWATIHLIWSTWRSWCLSLRGR